MKVPDSSHTFFFPPANALSVAKAVAPMSITAIAATITKYLVFIFLVAEGEFCLFALSKFRRSYKSDICSVRKSVAANN